MCHRLAAHSSPIDQSLGGRLNRQRQLAWSGFSFLVETIDLTETIGRRNAKTAEENSSAVHHEEGSNYKREP